MKDLGAMDDGTLDECSVSRDCDKAMLAWAGSDYVEFSLLFKIFVPRNEIVDKRRLFF